MPISFPQHIEPFKLAGLGERLTGTLPFSSLKRAIQASDAGRANDAKLVCVSLEFGIDESGHRYMDGVLSVPLDLRCERCMQPLHIPIEARVCLGIVKSESEAELLPARYDPLVLEQAEISLLKVIEDELLLVMPIVARHPAGQCQATPASGELQEDMVEERRENPFAVLAKLKSGSEN